MKKPTAPTNGNTAGRQPGHDTKVLRVLAIFAAGHSLNRFDAEQIGDHCLHSTISSISRRYGLEFIKQWEKVPGYSGGLTRVIRYRLAPAELARACEIVRLANLPKPARNSLPTTNQDLAAWAKCKGHRQARPGESYSEYCRHLSRFLGK
jgi:hypothetical protein